ncbi:MAG: efflux RND transporter permease subunit [Candidatus Methylomirabilales bacterium]|nr:efflux RND transporter permease subunit [candidate division NC10 bacterium]
MKKLVEFSVRNRVLVNLLTLFVLGTGLVTYFQMPRELFPEFSRQAVQIVTTFLGASPEEVEKLITAPIEEEVAEVDGLDELLSVSQEGRSQILLKFQPDTDMNRALSDVRAALDNVTDLPQEAKEPEVHEVKSTFPVITVSLAGDIDEATLRDMAKDLRDDLRRIPGVSRVRILGTRERQIWVEVDPARLDEYRISLDDVRAAIAAHNRNVPGGTMKTSRGEILIRTLGEAAGAPEVERIILRSVATGTPLTVGDVASVRETFEEPTTIGRWGGHPAINLVVNKERKGDAIDIAASVRALVEEVRIRLPETVKIGVYNDFSVFIRKRLNTLRVSGAIGLTIVLLALWAFVRTRIALLTGLGIPFAMLGGIILMSMYGISLNMISLFSLILVLGLLVDDAIVVTENVYRYVEQGMDSRQAAIQGTAEVAWPVVATVMTTVAAFLPLLLIPGTMGVFLAPIPIVVTFTLLGSLLEALVVLPSHLSDVITPAYAQRVRRRELPWLTRLRHAYGILLGTALKWRYVTVAFLFCTTVLLGATAWYRIPFVLFREFESSQFLINFETSSGAKIEDTLEVAKRAEQVVLSLPPGELQSLATNVGISFLDVHRAERGPNLGQLMVELEEDRRRSVNEVITDLRAGIEQIPGITKLQFMKTQSGPGGPAIEARVVGNDIPVLRKLATEVKAFLQGIPGVKDVRDDFTEGKEELQITLIPEARALGLDLGQIARQVQQAFLGVEASTIQRRDEDIPIVVRFPQAARRSLETVARMKLTLPSGEKVFLRDVARLETAIGNSKIRRDDQKRTITVLADVDSREANAFQVAQRLKRKFADVGRQVPGYRVVVKGERQEAEASLAALPKVSLIALMLIYFILGSLFQSFIQPFIVMAAIPFALDGVVIGHLIMGEPLSFLSMMGLVALGGVVVNDSLILVDFINRSREAGTPRDEAILASGVARLRPVLLTTVTTVGGLIPLAFFASGQAKFLSPMAISVVWGLSFATLLTLILIPCLYAILEDLKGLILRKLGLPVGAEAPLQRS